MDGMFGGGGAQRSGPGRKSTYCVADGEFLFGADDGSAAGGGVEGAFAADDGFALRGGAFGFAADFGDGVPVVHGWGWRGGCCGGCCVEGWWFIYYWSGIDKVVFMLWG